jgi:hypothetical protein
MSAGITGMHHHIPLVPRFLVKHYSECFLVLEENNIKIIRPNKVNRI